MASGLRSCCTEIDPFVRTANISAIPAASPMQATESNRLRPDQTGDTGFAAMSPFDIAPAVVIDQPARTRQRRHDTVAGVDAQAAIDTCEVRPLADVDADRTHGDAEVAGDAVAGLLAAA